MKKKLLAVLLMIGMAVSVVACGNGEVTNDTVLEKETDLTEESSEGDNASSDTLTEEEGNANSNIATVKINGNKYDLTGDFKEVVDQMVKDGMKTEGWCQVAPKRIINVDNESKRLQLKRYQLQSPELEWETSFDIASDSDFANVEALEGYAECYEEHGLRHIFRAVYMDGEIVDLEELEEEYEAFVACLEAEGNVKAMEKYFPLSDYRAICGGVYGDSNVNSRLYNANADYAEIKEYFDKKGYSFKNETLYALAFQKAGQALNNGEIDSFITVFFEDTEGRPGMGSIGMIYSEYYFE